MGDISTLSSSGVFSSLQPPEPVVLSIENIFANSMPLKERLVGESSGEEFSWVILLLRLPLSLLVSVLVLILVFVLLLFVLEVAVLSKVLNTGLREDFFGDLEVVSTLWAFEEEEGEVDDVDDECS